MRRAALVAVVGVTLAAPAVAHGSVVSAIGSELAQQGAKAAIAHFAPSLSKQLDATSAQLQSIGAQLEQLDQKLNDLKAYTAGVGYRLQCGDNVTHLNTVLGSADGHLRMLTFAATETGIQRTLQLDDLARDSALLRSQQSDLNLTLIGEFGLIQTCGAKIEHSFGNGRFITSQLRPDVEAFYAAYRAAHIALLTAQVNAATYAAAKAGAKPDDASTENLVNSLIRITEGYIASEEARIKPAIPSEFSYDKDYDVLIKVQPLPYQQRSSTGKTLVDSHWWVSGITTVPTCSAIQRTIEPFSAAQLRAWSVINFPVGGTIHCYDDSDVYHLFNVNTFAYTRPAIKDALIAATAPSIVWRPNNGYLQAKAYSYILKK